MSSFVMYSSATEMLSNSVETPQSSVIPSVMSDTPLYTSMSSSITPSSSSSIVPTSSITVNTVQYIVNNCYNSSGTLQCLIGHYLPACQSSSDDVQCVITQIEAASCVNSTMVNETCMENTYGECLISNQNTALTCLKNSVGAGSCLSSSDATQCLINAFSAGNSVFTGDTHSRLFVEVVCALIVISIQKLWITSFL
ncbi:unnamed protein product [Mytilus coruscus]|uniref:Uncharacterized protein n=1 Tax=Mytilus coruscus TaxID=42192 RepID=A0A6J8EFJ8_MYTCO|nr:unnamed protein product [Mytilus coruscus]